MLAALIRRDITLASRTPGAWLLGLVFFALFLVLCAISLGGELNKMQPLAPALIWLAVVFSQMLAFNTLFQSDFEDGTLEQLVLSGTGSFFIAVSRATAFLSAHSFQFCSLYPLLGLVSRFPLLKSSLFACLSYARRQPLISYGIMTSAIMVGKPQGGFLSVLITAPFLIPLLIFGIAAVDSYAANGLFNLELQALLGLSFIGIAIGLPAASAALSANLE